MRTVSFFLLMFFCSIAMSHDTRLAHFFTYVKDGKMICEAKIDREDIVKVLEAEITSNVLSDYLKDHLSFHFDGEKLEIELAKLEISEDWIKINLNLNTSNTQPSEIEIFNDVLSEEIKGHDNLMRFILHDRKRIFRLNKEKQQTSFSYNRINHENN